MRSASVWMRTFAKTIDGRRNRRLHDRPFDRGATAPGGLISDLGGRGALLTMQVCCRLSQIDTSGEERPSGCL
jgi:hypothetical protein